MKKFFSVFSFAVMALAAAVSFSSCSKDDDDIIDPKPEPVVYEGNLKAIVSEAIFEYCDVTIYVECDGKTEAYPLDEKTKIADTKLATIFGLDPTTPLPGRAVELSKFQFNTAPVKAYAKAVVTEAGKAKIAQATVDVEDFSFVVNLELNGNHYLHLDSFTQGYTPYVATLEEFLGMVTPKWTVTLK